MEVEGKKMGGGRKILGMRLQWEGHVDGESVIFQNHVTCVISSLTTCNTSRLQTDVNSTRVLNSSVMRMMFLLFTEP